MLEEENDEDLDEADRERPAVPWFQCDVQNLIILQAITLDGLGQTAQALKLWHEALDFCLHKLPPNDESVVVIAAQAALCSWHLAEQQQQQQHTDDGIHNTNHADEKDPLARARHYAALALNTHHVLFQGGVSRFRRRLQRDLLLPLRPHRSEEDGSATTASTSWPSAIEALWPLQS